MSPSLNSAGLVFNYLLYEIRETNCVCKTDWFWGVLDIIVTTFWCGEMPFFVNYLMNSFVPTESVFWGRRWSVWSEAKGQLRGMIILNWCYCWRIGNLPCLLPKLFVICCFKVFLGWQKKAELCVCVAQTICATSETYWGCRTVLQHVQLFIQKKNVADMNETRSVLGMEDEHCRGCRTQRRRLLSAGHVMRRVISIEIEWWCHFEAAYDSAQDFNCCLWP